MIKVTSLIENTTSSKQYKCEHGLSLYIQLDDKSYLLDTGASDSFIENAKKLNIDLSNLDGVFLSHNHSDHISGLESLLKMNNDVKVYVSKNFKQELFFKLIIKKKISMDNTIYQTYKDRFIFIDDVYKIDDKLSLLSVTKIDDEFVCKDKNLFKKVDSNLVRDDFKHEIFLVLEHHKKSIIISSCSHNGIVNIVNTTKQEFKRPIESVVAGFHMMGFGLKKINCNDEYIKKTVSFLDKEVQSSVYTFHCTGIPAYAIIKGQLKDKVNYLKTGESILFE